jgi:hypothetical protein
LACPALHLRPSLSLSLFSSWPPPPSALFRPAITRPFLNRTVPRHRKRPAKTRSDTAPFLHFPAASTPARPSYIPSTKRKQEKTDRRSINTFSTIAWRTADPFLLAIIRRTILTERNESSSSASPEASITDRRHQPTLSIHSLQHRLPGCPAPRHQLPVRVLCEKLPSFRGARHQISECPVCCHIRVASRIPPRYPRPPENLRLMDRGTYHER